VLIADCPAILECRVASWPSQTQGISKDELQMVMRYIDELGDGGGTIEFKELELAFRR
jgi:hypothetical protein